ncbi:MAG: flagellar basal body rod protein FlgC [Hyphomicrobiales bacterium]|nr:flagellar basal body rod protein FlgC [Hyphomicrobiales bacterium]
MLDALQASMRVAGSALEAQSIRMRVVSENIANAQSTGAAPGEDPYVRKTVTFGSELDRAARAEMVAVKRIGVDAAPFRIVSDPGNPAADAKGNVKLPNVDPLIEVADLRESNRAYEANLQTIKEARDLFAMTIDLLKS